MSQMVYEQEGRESSWPLFPTTDTPDQSATLERPGARLRQALARASISFEWTERSVAPRPTPIQH